MNTLSITIVVPIYNSETILNDVLSSLEKQKYPIEEIILIDNNSKDTSFKIASDYANISKFKVRAIRHKEDRGLSYSYNEAIGLAKTSHLITLQSDCLIMGEDDVKKLINPFYTDNVVVTCSLQTTPWQIWNKYNFWQKCLFSRHVGKILSGRNGRFCCFSIEALRKVGGYNEKTYRTAGEDGDILLRLGEIGEIKDVDIVVKHLHNNNSKFSFFDYLYKENQLAEAVGACLSVNIKKVKLRSLPTALARPIIVFGVFIPVINNIFFVIIFLYSIFFTKYVFLKKWKDIRIIILPFVNIFLLYSYTYYFLKGFLLKKQGL